MLKESKGNVFRVWLIYQIFFMMGMADIPYIFHDGYIPADMPYMYIYGGKHY